MECHQVAIRRVRLPAIVILVLGICSCGPKGDATTLVSGQVTDGATGAGLVGVRVSAFGDSLPGDVTNDSGNYRIDCGFGRYEGPVAFESDDHEPVTLQIPGDAEAVNGTFDYRLDVAMTRRGE
jgi:hypothetical protein